MVDYLKVVSFAGFFKWYWHFWIWNLLKITIQFMKVWKVWRSVNNLHLNASRNILKVNLVKPVMLTVKKQTINWYDLRLSGIQKQGFHYFFFYDKNQVWNAARKYFIIEHSIKVITKKNKYREFRALERLKTKKMVYKIFIFF